MKKENIALIYGIIFGSILIFIEGVMSKIFDVDITLLLLSFIIVMLFAIWYIICTRLD